MTAPLVVPFLLLAGVLLVSGAAKVSDRVATADMFTALRVPFVSPAVGAAALPYVEIVLGLALLLARGPLLVVASGVTLLLFTTYWLLIARALTFDPPVSCACFGKLGGHLVDGWTLARNTLLVGLSVVALVSAARGVDVIGGLADFTSTDVAWLCVVVDRGRAHLARRTLLRGPGPRASGRGRRCPGLRPRADPVRRPRERRRPALDPARAVEHPRPVAGVPQPGLRSVRARRLPVGPVGIGAGRRRGRPRGLLRAARRAAEAGARHRDHALRARHERHPRLRGLRHARRPCCSGRTATSPADPSPARTPMETMVQDILDQLADAQPGHDHEHDHQH